jgi:putative ABC transport system ATP-binding protein
MELLQNLNNGGMTTIMVTHSPDCARYARRIMQVSDGRLVEDDEKGII